MIAFRVDGDKNLLNLVEAELGSRLLRAYLVDNARDANVLSRFLACLSYCFSNLLYCFLLGFWTINMGLLQTNQ